MHEFEIMFEVPNGFGGFHGRNQIRLRKLGIEAIEDPEPGTIYEQMSVSKLCNTFHPTNPSADLSHRDFI